MTLEVILAHIALAKENISTLQTRLKYYLVVMLGARQYQLNEISKHNIDLFEYPEIFAPGQKAEKLHKRWSNYKIMKNQTDELKKKAESKQNKNQETGQKFQNRLKKALALMAVIQTDLERQLETIRFVKPQIELRFGQLDPEAIQEIKEFPFIKTLGKTDPSAASIRIIIG